MEWVRSITTVAVVFLATAAGAVLANVYAASHHRRKNWTTFIAASAVGSLVAIGIVARTELRKKGAKKKEDLGSRMINGFSHGFTWRGAGDAIEVFVELLIGSGE